MTDTRATASTLVDDAMAEAIHRYGPSGDVEGALIFFRCATQPMDSTYELLSAVAEWLASKTEKAN